MEEEKEEIMIEMALTEMPRLLDLTFDEDRATEKIEKLKKDIKEFGNYDIEKEGERIIGFIDSGLDTPDDVIIIFYEKEDLVRMRILRLNYGIPMGDVQVLCDR